MKHKIKTHDKNIKLAARGKPSDDATFYSAEKIDTFSICWLSYSYPFLSMIDFSIVFDALGKMIKKWFSNKGGSTIISKKSHETI